MKTDEVYKGLTSVQRRRVEMRADGMLWREIAEIEGVSISTIQRCLSLAEAKMRKNLLNNKENPK